MTAEPPCRRVSGKPLDAPGLEALALRYVEQFQTTRARLVRHLAAKLRQRGWQGKEPPDLEALAQRLALRGYIDEAAYGDARSRAMKARGLGARRIGARLRADGLEPPGEDDPAEALELALIFARRRRLGPFGPASTDPRVRQKQMAAMLRAGHAPAVAREVLRQSVPDAQPEDDICPDL